MNYKKMLEDSRKESKKSYKSLSNQKKIYDNWLKYGEHRTKEDVINELIIERDRLIVELKLYEDNRKHLNKLLEQKDNQLDKIKEICEKQFIDFEGHNKRYAPVNTREIIEVLEKIND